MIVIQDDVWRAECIAGMGWDSDCTVQVYPIDCADYVTYEYPNRNTAIKQYKIILDAWQQEIVRIAR
jgi:hypothetical protein